MLKRLEIRHLKLIQAIAETGSLSAAARGLHLTQSALSHQLKVLEDTVQGALFLRHGKKMVMTESGRRVLSAAQRVLGELTEMGEDLAELNRGEKASIRIATECYTSFHWLPRVIPLFQKQHPNVDIQLKPEISNNLSAQLESGELDLAIRMAPAKSKFENHPLFVDDIVVAMSPDHSLAQHNAIAKEQLLEQHLLLYHSGKSRLLRALFNDYQISQIHCTEMPLTEAILEWCSAGLGVTIMAKWAAQRWVDSGDILVRPLDSKWAKRHWHAVTLKQNLPSHTQDFISLLNRHPPC